MQIAYYRNESLMIIGLGIGIGKVTEHPDSDSGKREFKPLKNFSEFTIQRRNPRVCISTRSHYWISEKVNVEVHELKEDEVHEDEFNVNFQDQIQVPLKEEIHVPTFFNGETSYPSHPPGFEHMKQSPSYTSKVQETKMTHLELFRLKSMWGNFKFDYAYSMARGRSGGLVSMWDPNMFVEAIWCNVAFIIVKGHWNNSMGNCFMINIYAPQDSSAKSSLWNKIADFMHQHNRKFILFSYMNVVCHENERFGSIFSRLVADHFNAFIDSLGLIDLPIGGRLFTWMNKADTKLSKLDQFLITEDVLDSTPDIRITALDRLWSDHTPILLHVLKSDFGPTPFKFYNSWLLHDDFDDIVKSAWSKLGN
ncbi:RNA-directed DNA polymerase, eukaryota, reverse transcriptase zinc-binding domain protein [Tanacetum coccineum]